MALSLAPNAPGNAYFDGTQVTLTANPSGGYVLQSWGGDCSGVSNDTPTCGLTMDTDKDVDVDFVAVTAATT